jgi:hypothetical protein
MAFAYVVRCTFDEAGVSARDAFVAWLRDVHVADVCRSGAERGEIVVLDAPCAAEVRYQFASRAAFEAYLRDHAGARRSEGLAALARVGVAPGRGASFERWTGEIVEPAAS